MNQGCKDVFGEWISSKLKNLALIGYSIVAICLVILAMSVYMWRRLASGLEKVLWHNLAVERFLFAITVLILIVAGIFIGANSP